MLVVTAGNNKYDYQKTIRFCLNQCEKFNYKTLVYDLGGLGFGYPVEDVRLTSPHRNIIYSLKPNLILEAMSYAMPGELIAWVDGDATLIAPINELEADTFDVGVTVRPKVNKRKTSYINAGVFFVRNTKNGILFMEHWISQMPPVPPLDTKEKPKGYSDQEVLESILLSHINVVPWDAFNTTHSVAGAQLKILEGAIYNNLSVHEPETRRAPGVVKILHFRNHTMDRLDEYIKDYL